MADFRGSVHYNIPQWIEDNQKFFLPPVCNKMMHGSGQLKVFYVGGPNTRKDFHLEEGEELFYMPKGGMNLVTMEGGKFKDVIIKEGQIFLLPGKIPHSPQRYADTIGLVVERERAKAELDCLRYFVENSTETLFEKWFYCEDLGTQLVPVIKEFFASEQCKSRKPIPGTITDNPPWVPDSHRILEGPFYLHPWLTKHRGEIDEVGSKNLFNESYQSDIYIYGRGKNENIHRKGAETWLWQLEGSSNVIVGGEKITLKADDSLLIKSGESFNHIRPEGSLTMSVVLDYAQKKRGFAHLKKFTN